MKGKHFHLFRAPDRITGPHIDKDRRPMK